MKLYPFQEPVADKVFDYMLNNPGKHPLVGMPTGSGKTLVITDIIKKAMLRWPDTHTLVLSHVKEILQQNYNTIKENCDFDVGLYSSGLKSREIHQVTVAGIQSVYRHPEWFEKYKFIIIDEAHMIPLSGTGMYRSFFDTLHNPRYFGLTATPFRLGGGYIYGPTDETLFDDLVYDLTYMDAFNKLIEDGYLCQLVTKATKLEMDVKGLHKRGGEFIDKELSDRFDKKKITDLAIQEIIKAGENYKKWLIFAIDIEHAEHITESLLAGGVKAYIVHSKMGGTQRDKVIAMFKSDELRALVNVNIVTTGIDIANIDLIGLLRPSHSPVFHVQSIGRGLRIAHGKTHCLVLDFAGNTERLGAINDITVKKKRKGREDGEPITKRCPECNTIHHPTVKVCTVCGFKFKFKTLLTMGSSGKPIVATTKKNWHLVDNVEYAIHSKNNRPTSVLVSYLCGLRLFKEWVCVEHKGYAKHRASHWIKVRQGRPCASADQLISQSVDLDIPTMIEVDERNKYPNITRYKFNRV